MNQTATTRNAAGFSLLELLIAMTLTLVMLGIASTVLSAGFRIRSKENSTSDAIADVQRALNIMSREVANAGFNLNTNGIVAGDSDSTHLRIRSNLNKYDSTASAASRTGVIDAGEDLKYFVNGASNTDYLVRYDVNATGTKHTVLANKLDSLFIHYFASRVTYSTSGCDISAPSSGEVNPALASYVVIAVCVQIPASGTPNTAGYQPASNVLLVSDVTLRNATLNSF
ncbi:MAG TPA: prepilin-type N-terminal cleavage/methylation domain-containing protein [Pyrinomonadaceae bacterium]